jgi:hypothetical protein
LGPHAAGDDRGGLELNNLRANGHPHGGPWRQCHCPAGHGYFVETHGTIFHGKHASAERIVRVLACLAEGLGLRATARGVEVAPTTVLAWLGEAAAQLRTLSAHVLGKGHVNQGPRDALSAVWRAVKAGAISADEAITRLERSPYGVWTAMDPERTLLGGIAVGTRTLAMAQRVVPQGVQGLAPGGVPLCLTDGFREYRTAFLAPFGHWRPPERRQDKGPRPKPRWRPRPVLLSAPGVQASRRRRIVGGKHRVVCGPLAQVHQGLVACGRKSNTAFVARLHLDIRQRVAAVGRRVNPRCQGAEGRRHQRTGSHAYDHCCLPHASLRQPWLVPALTHGRGSAKVGRPCPPAMAAGLPDHVWSLQEGWRYRVPPWPQAQTASNRMPVDDRAGEQLACAPLEVHRVARGVEHPLGGLMTG